MVEALPPIVQEPKRKRRWGRWFLIAFLVVFILWAVISEGPFAQQVQEFVGWKHDRVILDNSFSVGPHTFRYYKFVLPEGSVNVAVVGQFSVTAETRTANITDRDQRAPSDHNIEVYVLSDPAFAAWRSGSTMSFVYDSGLVSAGTVPADVRVGSGIYYVVFSNKASAKESKPIRARMLLRYRSWLRRTFTRGS